MGSNQQMFRQLIRDRLKEGVDAAAIRVELEGYGLKPDEIRELAQEVAAADRGASTFEKLYEWLPVVMMLPGSVFLAVLYATMSRPMFAVTCFSAGGMLSGLSGFALRMMAKANRQRNQVGGTWTAVLSEPGKYWKVLVGLVCGWLLMGGGLVIDPHAISHLREGRHDQIEGHERYED